MSLPDDRPSRQPTSQIAGNRAALFITCDVIEPINGNVEEPARQERYQQGKGTGKCRSLSFTPSSRRRKNPSRRCAAMQEKFGFLPNVMGTMAENPVLLNGFAAQLRKLPWRQLRRVREAGVAAHQCGHAQMPVDRCGSLHLCDRGRRARRATSRRSATASCPKNPKYAALSAITKTLIEKQRQCDRG